jgi:cytoskeletal protein RodZ
MGAINWRVVGPVLGLAAAVLVVFFLIFSALGGEPEEPPRVVEEMSPTPTATATRRPGDATAIPRTSTPSATRTATPTVTGTPGATQTPTPTGTPRSSTGVTAVARQPTHVRSGPDTTFDVVSDVFEGETVEVIGKDSEQAYFIKVIPPDGRPQGWVARERFEVKGDLSKVPIVR